jgi:predicted aldo/keto reductase-like oxidoreductase
MAHDETNHPDRRTFLQAGTVVAASTLGGVRGAGAQEPAANAEKVPELPRRKLGRTGVEITILDQGALLGGPNVERLVRSSFAQGIRVFDTAKVYGSEPNLAVWFQKEPEVRKQIFLVTKDMPKTAGEMIKSVDQRLAALKTDYIDLYFLHGFGDKDCFGVDGAIKLMESQEFKEAAETIRKSGKAKFIGFSSHNPDRAPIIEAAAKAGVVDAIMIQYRPWLDKDSALNKSIDAAHKAGIGIISMKQIAGMRFGDKPVGNILEDVKKRVPMLAERNLTPYQGLLHAIWTDERITSVCTSMRNTDQIRLNVQAAHTYEPVKVADIHRLRDAAIAYGQTLCADCDGRCAAAAGTSAELGNLTRFLTYHDQMGLRSEARKQYAALSPEARDWSGADLEAATEACPNRLDFAKLLPEIDKYLA